LTNLEIEGSEKSKTNNGINFKQSLFEVFIGQY